MSHEEIDHLRELRSLAIQCIEPFAASKGVKPSACWLGIYASDEMKLITFATLREELADVCKVSGIEFIHWMREFPPAATHGDGIAVLPFMPQKFNCPRCRKSHVMAGTVDELCVRCDRVVKEIAE